MRLHKCFVALLLLVFPLMMLPAADKKMNIILCIGQSNMAGRAPIPAEALKPIPRVGLLNTEGAWVPAVAPLNLYSSVRKDEKMQKLGMAFSFAQALSAGFPKKTFGLVHNARGGTRIGDWQRGKVYYEAALKRLRPVLNNGQLIGVIWHQGESDAGSKTYAKDLRNMIESFRKDLKRPDLPFVIGEVLQESALANNKAMREYADSDPRCSLVSASDLKRYDFAHFDAPSQITMGQRYAVALVKLLKQKR